MTLYLQRAERADRLVDGLAAVLADAPADPFTGEVVAVPTRGMERWVTQRLSHVLGATAGRADGVCANVAFPSPDEMLGDAVAAASGIDPRQDPWRPDRTVWPLLHVMDESAGRGWCAPLTSYLRAGSDDPVAQGRRFAAASHLAELFASYGTNRPAMLQAWATGDDTDGLGERLPVDVRWQAALWRRLRARLAQPSPAERLGPACDALRERPDLAALPERLSLFGLTRLPPGQLAVLAALAAGRQVHLWLLHPSAVLWARVLPLASGPTRRREDPTADQVRNPLLASLGRDARELQRVLTDPGVLVGDRHLALATRTDTLLARVQHDLRHDREPAGTPRAGADDARPVLGGTDASLQVHACHGRVRQVEVLRDVLLGLLADDPVLEPRDVLVMCPDVEAFAPLIWAAFGLAGSGEETSPNPGHGLRVRLADRSLRQTNPLLTAVGRLLDLADARLTGTEVLDFADLAPVRRRFCFDDDELARAREWAAEAGVRWGIDRDTRARFQLDRFGQNTWQAGIDRLLLGTAMSEEERCWVGLALPLDDVGSQDVDLVGRFAEYVDRLREALAALAGPQPLEAWLEGIDNAVSSLAAVSERDGWQAAQLARELADVAESAATAGPGVPLALQDVRTLFAGRVRGRPTRANFRTGNLTVCTLNPMRSVPHKVVCLLGLDDGVFPRAVAADGDDVLARDPCVGERDPRSEDRQLFLDAVLSATEHLVITYDGADERTNTANPPAVPLGELLDAVDATVRATDGKRAREHIVVRHPLQPFDPRNFRPGSLGRSGPLSFDTSALGGARALSAPRVTPLPFLPSPLPAMSTTEPVELGRLVSFVEHPVKAFLRQRLGVALPSSEDELSDVLPVELDALSGWQIGNRMLRARLAGVDAAACSEAEWRRGALPPGPLGRIVLDDTKADVERLVAAVDGLWSAEPRTVDVAVPALTPGGVAVSGTVPGIHGHTLLTVTYSKLSAKQRLGAWVRLVALSVAHPDATYRAVTVGRTRGGAQRSIVDALEPDAAREDLAVLLDLYVRGMREPLPMALRSSATYADSRQRGCKPDAALSKADKHWSQSSFGEAAEPEHRLVWGPGTALAVLAAAPPADDEQGMAWPDEPSRFAVLALRLWESVLAAERIENA